MRHAPLVCLLLALTLATVSMAGDIQVTCEPGLRVFLDNQLAGTSSASEHGLHLTNVPEGKHTIRVEKTGCFPQGFQVEVSKLPTQVTVGRFTQILDGASIVKPTPSADAREMVGKLVITSAPQYCAIAIDGKSRAKKDTFLTIGPLFRGKHSISFTGGGHSPISTVVDMEPGADVTVHGDLLNGKVDVSYEGIGSLRVISTPQVCKIKFLGKLETKTSPIFNRSYLPAGVHRMTVNWGTKLMSADVLITNHHRTVVVIDFSRDAIPFRFSYEPE
ncbi:MAG: hypothetical protein LJE95_13830 [Acidobacteria bacterium]|nr:hypothetical protein [Acidobacteriota bacterium]